MVGRTHINDVDAFAAQLLDMQQRLASMERTAGRTKVTGNTVGPWTLAPSPHTGGEIRLTTNGDPSTGYNLLGAYGSTYLNP
jgi:hypothetical protein